MIISRSILLLIIGIALLTNGCNRDKNKPDKETTPSPSSQSSAPRTPLPVKPQIPAEWLQSKKDQEPKIINEISDNSGEIIFSLSRDSRVSLGVYDKTSGRMLRELLRGAELKAGIHHLTWDGLDKYGVAAIPGTYQWKLVASQGLKAEYLLNLGINPPHSPYGRWPGNHIPVNVIATDETGVYLASTLAESKTQIVKQSPDMKKQIWATTQTYDGNNPIAFGAAAGKLIGLQETGNVRTYNRDTGAIESTWDLKWDGVKANNLSASSNSVVLAFKDKNAIRTMNPSSGSVIDTINLPSPHAVAINTTGNILAISFSTNQAGATGSQPRIEYKVVEVNPSTKEITDRITGLDSPTDITVDPTNGYIYVFDSGKTQQIKKYDKNFKPLAVFGAPGGRQDGVYIRENFRDITDMSVDGKGNLLVAEISAPRRTFLVDTQNGAILDEWYGGQCFYMNAMIDKSDPVNVWFENSAGALTHAYVDYANKKWTVKATYHWDTRLTGTDGYTYKIADVKGRKYVVFGTPAVFLPDEAAGTLNAVAVAGVTNNTAYTWSDLNENGKMDDIEIVKYPGQKSDRLRASYSDTNFAVVSGGWWEKTAYYTYDRTGWAGKNQDIPVWDLKTFKPGPDFPDNDLPLSPETRGIIKDSDGNLYQFLFGNRMPGEERHGNMVFANEIGTARLFKWSPEGKLLYAVGRHGVDYGETGVFYQPAKILGETHGCMVLNDRTGQSPAVVWDKDGLFVGTFLDKRANPNDGIPDQIYKWNYHKDDSLVGDIYTFPNGDVLWFAAGDADSVVFRITGWDEIERQTGELILKEAAKPSEAKGTGLMGTYFKKDKFEDQAFTRVDPRLRFGKLSDWNPEMPWEFDKYKDTGISETKFSVIWEGELEPPLSEEYIFSVNSSGFVKVYVNGILAVKSSKGIAKGNPIFLKGGVKVPIKVELRSMGANPVCHLHWESLTLDRLTIPPSALYPSSTATTGPTE